MECFFCTQSSKLQVTCVTGELGKEGESRGRVTQWESRVGGSESGRGVHRSKRRVSDVMWKTPRLFRDHLFFRRIPKCTQLSNVKIHYTSQCLRNIVSEQTALRERVVQDGPHSGHQHLALPHGVG
ncbi:hypothetical protein J437_LFUL006933 [Ladona fulva]|uniref:Uncharacterized protein n=1 Tax=Ladona fulva TaxID=123851 RepID=A0A8K0P583_LADFU|nr:hypothetical protein J437_LFUL006933 [Ladona fulva]